MQTLFLTRWRPDRPTGGAQLRNQQNIQALARRGPVDVLSVGLPETVEPVDGVRTWRNFERQGARQPFPGAWLFRRGWHPLIEMYRTPKAEAALLEMLAARRYDLVVLEQIALASWLPLLKAKGLRIAYDAHNVEAALVAEIGGGTAADSMAGSEAGAPRGKGPGARLKAAMLGRRMAEVEAATVRGADLVWACSGVDAAELARRYAPEGDVPRAITVVPNAVDVGAWAGTRAGQARPVPPGAPIRLVYTGTLSYPPNEDAALTLVREVMPALRAAGERAELFLVGRNPTEALTRASAGDPDVTVTGEVVAIQPWLAEPCLMPMPIRLGSGTRLKILEAFAAGAAVISTAKGAEGIDGEDGRELRHAESVPDFVAAIRALWHDDAARRAQAEAAHRLVEAGYSWDAAARAIDASLATGSETGATGARQSQQSQRTRQAG